MTFIIARDGAGVTPGLRRRRERAERHKSFLKEQEAVAAAAAGSSFMGALEKRSEELGTIFIPFSLLKEHL